MQMELKGLLIGISSLNIGGAEKLAIEDANMLCDSYRVYMLTFKDGPMSGLLHPSVKLVVMERDGYLETARKIVRIIHENRIDILHAHLYAPMVIMAIAGQLASKPVIWNFHSHAFENKFLAKYLHRFTARFSSVKKILFPASQLSQYYVSEGYAFPAAKTVIAFNSGQHHEDREKAAEPSIVSIGYIGRVVALKRLEYLVSLAGQLREKGISSFRIDIVGDGPELESLKLESGKKQLQSYLYFHGFQTNTVSYYKGFDIFTLPSREEVLSLSLIDAGLAGLPSVAFRVGGNADIVEDGITGFLVDQQEEFHDRVSLLIQDPLLCKQMGEQARKACFQKFSPEARKKLLSDLYAGVL